MGVPGSKKVRFVLFCVIEGAFLVFLLQWGGGWGGGGVNIFRFGLCFLIEGPF